MDQAAETEPDPFSSLERFSQWFVVSEGVKLKQLKGMRYSASSGHQRVEYSRMVGDWRVQVADTFSGEQHIEGEVTAFNPVTGESAEIGDDLAGLDLLRSIFVEHPVAEETDEAFDTTSGNG